MTTTDYGTELRVLRVRAGINQSDAAELIGIYPATLGEVEQGKVIIASATFDDWKAKLEAKK